MAQPVWAANELPPAHSTYCAASLLLALSLSLSAGAVGAQTTDVQELRRAEERERALRQQQERTPDVRLPSATSPVAPTLLDNESPCFVVNTLELQILPSDPAPTPASDFFWALNAASGPQRSDSPIGRCLGAQGIGTVLRRVQDSIVAQGYITTRVLAAPQDLSAGTLSLTVIPGRIGAVRFLPQGSGHAHDATAQAALPAGRGELVNLRDIEQALENFKRVPSVNADIQLEAAAPSALPLSALSPSPAGPGTPGQSDLVISHQQHRPVRLALSLDDSGLQATGRYQGGMTLSYDNPLALNDLFYLSLNRSVLGHGLGGQPDGERGTYGTTVHYSVPLGYWLLGATASTNTYRQSIAGASQNYIYSGTSSNIEVKLSRLVFRDALRKTTLGLRAFKRSSSNFIDDTEIGVQRRVVGGFEASVNHRALMGNATLELDLAYKRGTGAFGALPAPEEAFGEGTSRLQIGTASVHFNAPFKAFAQALRYSTHLRAQINASALTPQDRFAIGGRATVRGFDGENSLAGERGFVWRNELSAALQGSGQEAFVGLDHGQVSGPGSEQLVGKRLTGAVLGVRGKLGNAQYELFVGAPVHQPEHFRSARYSAGFSLNYSF